MSFDHTALALNEVSVYDDTVHLLSNFTYGQNFQVFVWQVVTPCAQFSNGRNALRTSSTISRCRCPPNCIRVCLGPSVLGCTVLVSWDMRAASTIRNSFSYNVFALV